MINAPGIGSGLDVNSIVSQLMALERRPLVALQSKERSYQTQLSDYGKLKGALSAFNTAMQGLNTDAKFKVFSATSSDEKILTATASSTAAPGGYSVEVVRIAERHKLVSTTAYTETGTIAAGTTITIQVGSDTPFAVDIGGKTLSEAAIAINDATGNTGAGATVTKVDGGYKLMLSAVDTGSENALQVSYTGGDPFAFSVVNQDRDGTPGFTAADLDAVLKLDGNAALTATRSSNAVDDLIGGVTLNLKSAGTINLTVDRDNDKVTESAQAFVDAFNTLRTTIDGLRKGSLKSDSTLLSIESRILGVVNTPAADLQSGLAYLSEIGISIQKNGSIALDATAFEAALETNFSGVSDLFANDDQGFAFRLQGLADELLAADGLVDSRTDGLDARIKDIKDREAALERRLDTIEKRYRNQYTALDTLLGQMRTTSDFLTKQLANL